MAKKKLKYIKKSTKKKNHNRKEYNNNKKPSEALPCRSNISAHCTSAEVRRARAIAGGFGVGEKTADLSPLHDLIALEQLSLRKLLVTFTV